MTRKIRIRKGLDIQLAGEAPEVDLPLLQQNMSYAVVPDDYIGLIPKLAVKVGDRVKAGDPILFHKNAPEIKIVAPASGEIIAINRGDKRKILSVEIRGDKEIEYKEFKPITNITSIDKDSLKDLFLESGMWTFIKQRPYDIIADPKMEPRDIFITGILSQPLAPQIQTLAKGNEKAIQIAFDALKVLTKGSVYYSARVNELEFIQGAERIEVEGPHPAGLLSTLINKVKPINKDEIVWGLKLTDLILIGQFLLSGKVDLCRKIIVAGSEANLLGYTFIRQGVLIEEAFAGGLCKNPSLDRAIAGDVLSGRIIENNSKDKAFFPASCDMISVIPEGANIDEFLGWASLNPNKYSLSRSYFSWLFGKKRKYILDARIKGGERAMIMSNEYDRVFPLDIFPEYLLKACISFNITKMENLGIYEVAPEDFALCEFVDTSKIELQRIVREALNLLYKEMN